MHFLAEIVKEYGSRHITTVIIAQVWKRKCDWAREEDRYFRVTWLPLHASEWLTQI